MDMISIEFFTCWSQPPSNGKFDHEFADEFATYFPKKEGFIGRSELLWKLIQNGE